MQVAVIPLLKDNYAYLLTHESECVVVDPAEDAILRALDGQRVTQVWCTHHHGDHTDGVKALVAAFPQVAVVASAYDRARDRVPCQTVAVRGGSPLMLGSLKVSVLEVPGHTLGAVAYVVGGAVFTGDTLFLAGCGRIFEGTPELMHASLQQLAALPSETQVFVGHEYTEDNLKFARAAEPNNPAIAARAAAFLKGVSVPGKMHEELATNVFLRASNPVDFAALRQWKDRF